MSLSTIQDKFFASCYRNFPNPAPPQTLSFPYGYHCTYVHWHVTQNHALHIVHIQSEAQIRVNYSQLQDGFFAREKPVLILKLRHACTRTIHQLKPDSWTCNFVEVCGHNLLRLEVSVYNVYITNQFQTTFAQEGGEGGGWSKIRKETVSSKEENSQDFCPNYVQEFGLSDRIKMCGIILLSKTRKTPRYFMYYCKIIS
jgi:hypothetical protein